MLFRQPDSNNPLNYSQSVQEEKGVFQSRNSSGRKKRRRDQAFDGQKQGASQKQGARVDAEAPLPPRLHLLTQQPLAEVKPVKHIQETVSEKLLKSIRNLVLLLQTSSSQQMIQSLPALISATNSTPGIDYSQDALIRQINFHNKKMGKKKISEDGYCHGLVLLWLTMMSWGIEFLFYCLLKSIAECPPENLGQFSNAITFIVDLMDVGQNSEKYSKNTCTWQDADIIIGDVIPLLHETATYSKETLKKKLQGLSQESNMLAISGFKPIGLSYNLSGQRYFNYEEEGHTVGVYMRNHRYYFFDPNIETLGALEYSSQSLLVDAIWGGIFGYFDKRIDRTLTLQATHRKALLTQVSPAPSSTPVNLFPSREQKNTQAQPSLPSPSLPTMPPLQLPPSEEHPSLSDLPPLVQPPSYDPRLYGRPQAQMKTTRQDSSYLPRKGVRCDS